MALDRGGDALHELLHTAEVDRPHEIPIVLGIGEVIFQDAAELERVLPLDVADVVGKLIHRVGEPARRLDKHTVGGDDGRAGDVPDARQVYSGNHTQQASGTS